MLLSNILRYRYAHALNSLLVCRGSVCQSFDIKVLLASTRNALFDVILLSLTNAIQFLKVTKAANYRNNAFSIVISVCTYTYNVSYREYLIVIQVWGRRDRFLATTSEERNRNDC